MSQLGMPDSLDEWQEMFRKIYSERNKLLERRAQSILLRVVEEGSEVAEAFREENITLAEFGLTAEMMKKKRETEEKFRVLEWELPDVFAWLCTFCDYVRHKLSEDVWYKYPKVCPHCFQPTN